MLADFVPIGLGGLLLVVSLGTAVPDPSLLLGCLALAVVGQVGLADCSGCHPVGHVLMPIMASGDSVDVQDNGLVDLEASNGPALVTDGQVVVAAFYDHQG